MPAEFLCSLNARKSIWGFVFRDDPLRGTIARVPFDGRTVACAMFESWASNSAHTAKAGRSANFSDDPVTRRPLLCNAAARGTGKSVMQAVNMALFKQKFGGIPIEITFNDDQGISVFLFNPIASNSLADVQASDAAVALRIIDRALAFDQDIRGPDIVRNHHDSILTALQQASTDSSLHTIGPTIISSLVPLALAVARKVIGAPENII